MSYKSCFVQPLKENNYRIHLWDDGGYQTMAWNYHAYVECDDHDADKNMRRRAAALLVCSIACPDLRKSLVQFFPAETASRRVG